MSRLENMLSDWVTNGLMTTEQAKKITDYELKKPYRSWAIYGFLILGAVIIGLGVISLVAANWKELSDVLKLSIDFLLLISLAIGTYFAWEKKKPVLFEVLLILLMILCLASIGLISQIYHTGGRLYQALLLWSFITIGLAAASRHTLAPFIWGASFLSGISFFALKSTALQFVFFDQSRPIFMTAPILSALMAFLCRGFGGESAQSKAFKSLAVVGSLLALFVGETRILNGRFLDMNVQAFFPAYLLSAFLVFGIWRSLEYTKAQKILLVISLGFYHLLFHIPLWNINIGVSLPYAVCTLGVLAAMAIFFASFKYRKLFQGFLVAIGVRFLILYFQALGGLAETGIGLIFSGLFIIGMVVGWNKYRRNIATWAEGLV